jgi:hypothetical protein
MSGDRFRFSVIAILVAACGGGQVPPSSLNIPVAQPSVAIPAPTITPTSTATAAAAIRRTRLLVAWQSGDFAEADVAVEVENTGGTWVELDPGRSDYTIFNANASIKAKGTFLYAYPKYLAPGQIGYVAVDLKTSKAKASDLKNLEANIYFYEMVESDAIVLETASIANRKARSELEGPTTTGTLTNTSSKRLDSAVVGAFYVDGSGKFLGFSHANPIANVEAGQTVAFSTVVGAPPILLSAIKKTVAIASPSK